MAKKKDSGFDLKMQRIREIADTMQNRQLSLEESIQLYQEAQELIQACHGYLEKAELQVKQVTENGSLTDLDSL